MAEPAHIMVLPLLVATAMVLITVATHGVGLFGLSRLLRLEREHEAHFNFSPTSPRGIVFTFGLVLGLFIIHGMEIWLYAAVYLFVGALPDLHTAVYFSTITYATIGFDDDGLARAWQLLAAIEGINGVLLLGWSTAFFVSLIGRFRRS